MKNLKVKARAYALKNAVAHGGKAQSGAVISALFVEGLKKEDMKTYGKEINEIVSEVNGLSLDEQKKEFEKVRENISERDVREGLPELPGAKKGKVVMRFRPSPSGGLHVGHALTASLSYDYVKEFGGKFYVVIDDTNPENIYSKAYDLIKKDSKWLFNGEAEVIVSSDRMKIYYDYVEKLIKKKAVYVCTCSSEKFKGFVDLKEDCPCRNNDVKENEMRWKMMLKKGYDVGEAVLRFKSSMTDKNPAMRDFPLARINETSHLKQKKKYRVWPLMNLVVAIDDIDLGMTHIIRAKEHRDNAKRQEMIFKVLGKKYPWSSFLGRIHIKGMRLSSTEISTGVKEGKYSGWDDPKLPTISALKKKYKPEVFWKLAERIGLNENDKTIEEKEFFRLLDDFNRQ